MWAQLGIAPCGAKSVSGVAGGLGPALDPNGPRDSGLGCGISNARAKVVETAADVSFNGGGAGTLMKPVLMLPLGCAVSRRYAKPEFTSPRYCANRVPASLEFGGRQLSSACEMQKPSYLANLPLT